VNEWYYKTVYQEDYAAERTGPPTADNYLLNGMNVNLNTPPTGQRFQVNFKKGKKYLLRFINTSVDNHFKVHIGK
jgi:L-ascorbate oxidase